ncbi:hepatitis A virus cellular receptor 1 [Cynocephalus volans]|uniref:hepatitis A virus cellular receptor 1 n=1 Tax=Cynocephalus volans TaxID=110931 RepID=UPI002FC8F50D
MHPQEVILSLILLLTDAVVSYTKVSGMVGQPVTLPCTYSVANGKVTSMCWGRGECPMFKCSDDIIWTDGSQVTFWKHMRYQLMGNLLKGNVSLTIENAAEADSGLYCCRVEHSGWFNDMKVTLSLEIKPVATSPSPIQPAETQSTTLWETGTQPTSSPLYSHPTDGNGTVTQPSEGVWHNNQTQESSAQNSWMTTTKGIYVGICIFALMLLAVLVVVIVKKYFYIINKMQQARTVIFKGPQTRALQSAAEVRVRAQDNIYIIEDNLYVMD